MNKYKAFRKMYEDAGIKIYAFKLPPTMNMSDQEYEYIWNVGETLGANHLTMELPADDALLQRVGRICRQAQTAHRVPHPWAGRRLGLRQGARRRPNTPRSTSM